MTRRRSATLEPLEADVQRAVRDMLERHPRVARVWRMNSGQMDVPAEDGKRKRVVRFNDLDGAPDLMGWLRDGRILGVECKRPSWRYPKDDHEREQAALLREINAAGGLAFFARSVEDVLERLGPLR